MDKKTSDMSAVVKMDPPDLKGLQLLLQGSISTQVNQGIQEYSLFLKEPHVLSQPKQHIERLKEAYRYRILAGIKVGGSVQDRHTYTCE